MKFLRIFASLAAVGLVVASCGKAPTAGTSQQTVVPEPRIVVPPSPGQCLVGTLPSELYTTGNEGDFGYSVVSIDTAAQTSPYEGLGGFERITVERDSPWELRAGQVVDQVYFDSEADHKRVQDACSRLPRNSQALSSVGTFPIMFAPISMVTRQITRERQTYPPGVLRHWKTIVIWACYAACDVFLPHTVQ